MPIRSPRCIAPNKSKAAYDDRSIRVIFQVRDQYVRAITTQTHGPVYKDSCVEFFFSPDSKAPLSYFNLEMNCCGTLLAHHYTGRGKTAVLWKVKIVKRYKSPVPFQGPICNELSHHYLTSNLSSPTKS